MFATRLEVPNQEEQKIDVSVPGFPFPSESQASQSLYEAQLKYFVECIEKDQTPNPGGSEGWVNAKVIDAAYQSNQRRKVVEIK
jgi:predicted dehydrogenase